MNNMEGLEEIAFRIIANVGTAKSNYIRAIDEAEKGNYDDANNLIKEGEVHFLEGHKAHQELLTLVGNNELENTNLLLVHAEDQLTTAETFGILAKKFICVYKTISNV